MQVFHFVSWLEQLSKLLSLCSPQSFSVFFEWKTFQYSIAFDFAPSNGWSLYEESEHDTIYHTSVNNRHTKATHWIFSATHNGGKYFLKKYSYLFLKHWLISPLIGDNFCIRVFAQAQVHTSTPRFRRRYILGQNYWVLCITLSGPASQIFFYYPINVKYVVYK